jgi:hypothetical protein
MLLDDFLSTLVGQYLRYDISFLSKNDADSRGPTYPLAMICCSAIELLGALASPDQFDTYKGRDYFVNYWNTFLYPNQVNSSDALMFYKLVRNGLSHT